MREYYVNVSLNGKFLFRTAWEDDKARADNAFVILKTSLPLAKVELFSREVAMRKEA